MTEQPESDRRGVSRRAFLRGGAAVAAVGASALGVGTLAGCVPPPTSPPAPPAPPEKSVPRGIGQDDIAIPFHGPHQAGILNREPAAAIIAALDTTAADRAALAATLRTVTDRARLLTSGTAPAPRDPRLPPDDSGILGPDVPPGSLTVTLGVGASLFDARYGLADRKPRELAPMPRFQNDALDPAQTHGDLILQLCADRVDTCLHALRDILAHTRDTLVLRWMQEGFNRPNQSQQVGRTSTRNLLGFKDGTANPDPTDVALMDQLVWLPAGGEPAWTVGGTYQVVRIIRMFVERWDRTALGEQERIIGRHKASGAPLGAQREEEVPSFEGDEQGEKTPLDAHIRLANPRTPEAMASRILRRGFSYSRGFDAAGQLNQGLLFVAFQRSLERGFATIQARLAGDSLDEYIRPVGGGYFFALPGATDAGRFLGDTLLA